MTTEFPPPDDRLIGKAMIRKIEAAQAPPLRTIKCDDVNRGSATDTTNDQTAWKAGSFTARALQFMEFPPISWIVENIIPAEGLTLLCSKPKFGKSWLAYDLCIACTTDRFTLGTIKPVQGDVLYLALEDSKRRLQRRMAKLLPSFGATWPERLTLKTEWRRLHEGGLDDIRAWHAQTMSGKPILVVIDVLAKVRRPVGNRQLYESDYEALADLTKLANELGLAIMVVHHTRKMAADDLLETVSGSYGVSGAADTILVMAKTVSGSVLDIRGRDVESAELAIEFDKATCRWRVLGNAAEVRVSEQRAQIITALKEADEPMKISALVDATAMKRNPLEVLLGRMARGGEIQRVGKGRYAHKDYAPPPKHTPRTGSPAKHQSAAHVPNVDAQTDRKTDVPSSQSAETIGKSTDVCPSVQSVCASPDAIAAGVSAGDVALALAPTQTDQTDGQISAKVAEKPGEFRAPDLSRNLSPSYRPTDGVIDGFPELPEFLRRVPLSDSPPVRRQKQHSQSSGWLCTQE
jgi:hypothetical protein